MSDSPLVRAAYEHALVSVQLYLWKSFAEWMDHVVKLADDGKIDPEEVVEALRDYASAMRERVIELEAQRLPNAVELDLAGWGPPPDDPPTPLQEP
jgi:hypothetical protein